MNIAENLKSLPFTIGVGNAPGIKDTIRVALMEELKFGDVLPAAATGKHLITANIEFREAVAASGDNPAIPAGGCVTLDISRKKNAFKANGKPEDGYTYYEPTFEAYLPMTDENKSHVLKYFNGAKLFLHFTDNNGKSRVGTSVICFVDPSVEENSNGYKLLFTFPMSGQEPFFYSGSVSLRG